MITLVLRSSKESFAPALTCKVILPLFPLEDDTVSQFSPHVAVQFPLALNEISAEPPACSIITLSVLMVKEESPDEPPEEVLSSLLQDEKLIINIKDRIISSKVLLVFIENCIFFLTKILHS